MDDMLDIPADRLMDAVDAIFEGLDELGGLSADRTPSDVLGTSRQPEAWCEFTRHEIVEAERFMRRCGLLAA